jgi:hypothetical protein
MHRAAVERDLEKGFRGLPLNWYDRLRAATTSGVTLFSFSMSSMVISLMLLFWLFNPSAG